MCQTHNCGEDVAQRFFTLEAGKLEAIRQLFLLALNETHPGDRLGGHIIWRWRGQHTSVDGEEV